MSSKWQICYNIRAQQLCSTVELKNIEKGITIKGGKTEVESELDFIKKHEKIPDTAKKELLDCLKKIPDLYSGSEFSSEPVPASLYLHDVEFMEGETQFLNSKPYKTVGIRNEQLLDALTEMVNNKILLPGDSNCVSPVFFVSKKIGDGENAEKGRLVFDYRKLNEKIKSKNFPLTPIQSFFDEAANYKIFSIIDVRNAFCQLA